MVKIIIENLAQKELLVEANKSVLSQFHSHFIDWMHECGGKGRCTTCKMKVLEGMENLTPPTHAELKYRREKQLDDDERLACQVRLKGNLVVRVPDETKLPHVKYT